MSEVGFCLIEFPGYEFYYDGKNGEMRVVGIRFKRDMKIRIGNNGYYVIDLQNREKKQIHKQNCWLAN